MKANAVRISPVAYALSFELLNMPGVHFSPDENPGGPNLHVPDAPATPVAPAKPEKLFTQAELNAIVGQRVSETEANVTKRLEEQASAKEAEAERLRQEEQGNFKTLYENLQKELENERFLVMKARVLSEFEIPVEDADRVVGKTEAEIRADADKFKKKYMKPTPTDVQTGPRPGAGTDGKHDYRPTEEERKRNLQKTAQGL